MAEPKPESAVWSLVAPGAALVAVPASEASFVLEDLRAGPRGSLEVLIRRASGSGRVTASVSRGAGGRLRGTHVSLGYASDIPGLDGAQRSELSLLFGVLLAAADAWVAERDTEPGDLIASLGLRGTLPFNIGGLRRLLGEGFAPGSELPYGYTVSAIYPSSHLGSDQHQSPELVLELRHASEPQLRIQLGPRAHDREAFVRSRHFNVSYLGDASSQGAQQLLTWFSLWLRLRDGAELAPVFGGSLGEEQFAALTAGVALGALRAGEPVLDLGGADGDAAAQASHGAATTQGAHGHLSGRRGAEEPRLNLAIDAECDQACAFCSVKQLSPSWGSGTDAQFDRLRIDLESNARAGVRRLRLNGYDPLAFSRVFELLILARELGYTRVDVFSPCTRLADAEFANRLLDCLPPDRHFYVPVYGHHAALHDAVVGSRGSFERVVRALEFLAARLEPEQLFITSVVVKQNVSSLRELTAWSARFTPNFHVQMPYPSSESPSDNYRASVASFVEVANATVGVPPVFVHGVPPCVYWQAAKRAGIAPHARVELDLPRRPLPGREYLKASYRHRALPVQQSAFVAAAVDCPHREECVLSVRCSGEILHSYADEKGISELVPLSLRDLLDECDASELRPD